MQVERSAVQPANDLVIVKTALLPVPPATAFGLFSEASALQSWLCEAANTEKRVGGRYELFWELTDPENDSTIGCQVTAFEQDRLLAFQWRSPRQFKSFANTADPLTHVVVSFHATAGGTAVTLVHSGWRSSAEWAQAAAWQEIAWNYAFQALAKKAEALTSAA